jgi:hypothetical protein
MKGTPANYLGRLVSKENFRTFIFAPHGGQKLVESWEEFESCMQSGLWFATKEDAFASVAVGEEHPKKSNRPKRVKKNEEVQEAEQEADSEKKDMDFEVKDDFLPKD